MSPLSLIDSIRPYLVRARTPYLPRLHRLHVPLPFKSLRFQGRNWADDHSVFPPIGEISIRNNNHPEGWHTRFGCVKLGKKRIQGRRAFFDQRVSAQLDLDKWLQPPDR